MSSRLPYFDDRLGPLPPWIDREEAAQVVEVARLEAVGCGFDPEAAAIEILVRPEWLAEANKVVGLRHPPMRTARQRDNFVRNQMILALFIAGFSQRRLAREFRMARSRIHVIVKRMKLLTRIA